MAQWATHTVRHIYEPISYKEWGLSDDGYNHCCVTTNNYCRNGCSNIEMVRVAPGAPSQSDVWDFHKSQYKAQR